MANNIDDLPMDSLSLLLAVIETGGFRSAAKKLGLAPSTVSEKIADLELSIGTPLLIRTTRSVMPTPTGRLLADRLAPLFTEVRGAIQDAASANRETRGRLRLNVPAAVLNDILPPIIDLYLGKNPNVDLEIVSDERLVDIVSSGCDAGIRYGEHLAQDMVAIPIGPRVQRLALAASPAYLEKKGCPHHPSELLEHNCIRVRFANGALVEWEFTKGDKTITIEPPAKVIVNTSAAHVALELATQGHGIVAAFENWLHTHIGQGLLVPILQDWWTEFEGPWLYYSSRFAPAPLRAFITTVNEYQRQFKPR
jgi:DNA-binding transcriptional LysR family regulator